MFDSRPGSKNSGVNRKPLPSRLEEDLNALTGIKANSTQQQSSSFGSRPLSNSNKVRQALDDSVERAMFDEIMGGISLDKGARGSSLSKLPVGSGFEAGRRNESLNVEDAPGDSTHSSPRDFTTHLLQRLQVVEKEARDNRQLLAQEIMKNQKLEEELKHFKQMSENTKENEKTIQELHDLYEENDDLKEKLQEMEEFLADYGLVWVGYKSENQTNAEAKGDSNDDLQERHSISFHDFQKAINALNNIIYTEPAQVHQRNKTARLVATSELVERVRITYYSNGLMIKAGPFRPCSSPSCRSFMQDVLDGYFPSEFRDMFPDGVIFDLIDQHKTEYSADIGAAFAEGGISQQQFLNRLPKTVVHNGNIISIRGDISDRLSAGGAADAKPESSSADGPAAAGSQKGKSIILNTAAAKSNENENHSLGKLVKIQVKWIDKSILIATMFQMNTIGDLRYEIYQHFNIQQTEEEKNKIELRNAYPSQLLFDYMTLQEAGLTPSGTVHARQI